MYYTTYFHTFRHWNILSHHYVTHTHTHTGMFLHWNSFSLPLRGSAVAYEEAVDSLLVDQVADMVSGSGSAFLVLTTSWAGYYFPAPMPAIDAVLPGRTCARDLVAQLIAALDARGVRLVLYYHYGKDDAAWWRAARFHCRPSPLPPLSRPSVTPVSLDASPNARAPWRS